MQVKIARPPWITTEQALGRPPAGRPELAQT